MITLLDKTKVSIFDYFYLFSVIIFAGYASGFVRGFGDIRTLGNTVLLFLTLIFAIKKRVHLGSSFFAVIGVFFLYSVFAILYTRSSQYFLFESMKWTMYFLVTYVICRGYGYRFFVISETVLFHLAIISLIGWALLFIVPYQFAELLSHISLGGFNKGDDAWAEYNAEYNILIYTINGINHMGESTAFYSIPRNAGFAWEPGAFSCFMCFAVFLNMLRTGLRLKNNTALVVFFIALISTQSTTGYVTFAVMTVFWTAASKKMYWLFILIPIFLYVATLPFISGKILDKSADITSISLDNVSAETKFDRLVSFKLLWEEFLKHPLFGYGFSESTLMTYEIEVWSGIGKLLAQFGALMTTIFIVLMIRSAQVFNRIYSVNNGYVLLIVMSGMMVSYNVWCLPFFMTFWLSCVFMKESQNSR